MTDLTQDFKAQIRDTAGACRHLQVMGGGTKSWYGNQTHDHDQMSVLRTIAHKGIVDYDPAELILTARSGTSIMALEQELAAHGQMLAFEPPRHGVASTLGGVVASSLSGPGRPFVCGVRDFVLGLHLIDGRGDVLKFGGQVMKNVAGYDVTRLMTGSLGVLGVITQVSLKVLPVPRATATVRFEKDQTAALEAVNVWSGQPIPLTATVWEKGMLTIRLSGAQAAVDSALVELGGNRVAPDVAHHYWDSLRDQTHDFFATSISMHGGKSLWRLSLPAVAPPLTEAQIPGADQVLVEWGGGQRWIWSDADSASIRNTASKLGGHAVRWNNLHEGGNTFSQPAPALMAIHRRLKQTFDPQGIFNPGRLYPDF